MELLDARARLDEVNDSRNLAGPILCSRVEEGEDRKVPSGVLRERDGERLAEEGVERRTGHT